MKLPVPYYQYLEAVFPPGLRIENKRRRLVEEEWFGDGRYFIADAAEEAVFPLRVHFRRSELFLGHSKTLSGDAREFIGGTNDEEGKWRGSELLALDFLAE
jgi:hypothetical protein